MKVKLELVARERRPRELYLAGAPRAIPRLRQPGGQGGWAGFPAGKCHRGAIRGSAIIDRGGYRQLMLPADARAGMGFVHDTERLHHTTRWRALRIGDTGGGAPDSAPRGIARSHAVHCVFVIPEPLVTIIISAPVGGAPASNFNTCAFVNPKISATCSVDNRPASRLRFNGLLSFHSWVRRAR